MAILSLPLVTSILKKTPKSSHIFLLLTAGRRINRDLPLIFRRNCFSVAARSISSSVSTATEHDHERPSSSSSSVLTFQQAIQRLQEYWASVGCAVMQCSNTEVGAGTMNPLTYLRVLGPEPWNVAYVEPSIRPDDSRYGENPNRLQRHTQFQVILKPDPGNSQDLFIRSLSALGINVNDHDIRFVEDNWESPVLGAWGLGWEIWMDGMEITQFTYFQQAGSLQLMPVSVEITYGLERILMLLQVLCVPSLSAGPRTFLLEIGTEELPPNDVVTACSQLKDLVKHLLEKQRLSHGIVQTYGTPFNSAVSPYQEHSYPYPILASALWESLSSCKHILQVREPKTQGTATSKCSRRRWILDGTGEKKLKKGEKGDILPKTDAGTVLAIADRLESLVGLFAAGCQPSSTNDPFGLRRISYGLVQLLVETNRNLELRHALELAAAVQPINVESQTIDNAHQFVTRRLEQLLMDKGINPEVVRAVLAERANQPCLATSSAHKMHALSKGELLPKIIEAYSRPTRIVRGKGVIDDWEVDEAAFETTEERALWSTFTSLKSKIHPDMEVDDFVEASVHLVQPLEDFFNNVFVMVEDERTRKNRLALLQKISDLPKGIVDLSILPGF